MIPLQPVQVTCPQCRRPFTSRLQSIIDVGAQPELKRQLLQGQINLVQCPTCGFTGSVATPLLYHDPSKELALLLVPTEMNLRRDEQEKLIGSLTNALMNSLPPEKRRGYLFQPKTFLSPESLVQAILGADGITPEMLQLQRQRLRLIEDLRGRLADEEQFAPFLEEHRSEIDYELLLLLRAMIDTAQAEGLGKELEQLKTLQRRLVEHYDGASPPPPAEVRVETFDDLLAILEGVQNDPETLEALVATNRPVFDYVFFQQVTDRIGAAEQAGAAERAGALRRLRQRLLEVTEAVDRATEEVLRQAALRLQRILRAGDPLAAAQEQLDQVDEAFLIVLAANIARAEDQGQVEVADSLRRLQSFILDRLEEQMPASMRVLNRLLRAGTAEERTAVLEADPDAVNAELMSTLEALVADAAAHQEPQLVSELNELLDHVKAHVKGRHGD